MWKKSSIYLNSFPRHSASYVARLFWNSAVGLKPASSCYRGKINRSPISQSFSVICGLMLRRCQKVYVSSEDGFHCGLVDVCDGFHEPALTLRYLRRESHCCAFFHHVLTVEGSREEVRTAVAKIFGHLADYFVRWNKELDGQSRKPRWFNSLQGGLSGAAFKKVYGLGRTLLGLMWNSEVFSRYCSSSL